MSAFYNECDPYAAEWLRNLIAAGHIAPGIVDERDIRDISPDELTGFTQCHFFAGIGVWSLALRLAGWPDDRPIWTGSCPCQPFSAAGKQQRFADDRHLWPVWFNLIRECRPSVVLGEQVASALDWLDLVSTDMEGEGYAFGASDLCAAGFGGAHIRQRLYFCGVALGDADDARLEKRWRGLVEVVGSQGREAAERSSRLSSVGGRLADGSSQRRNGIESPAGQDGRHRAEASGGACDTPAPLLGRNPADWLLCRDGKWRPVGPGTFPLVDAAPARVGRLRAYGNGLDAETATQFVSAVIETMATEPVG